MVDRNTVCCLCGDLGFPDKLFRCARCVSRFQHSYCSNNYDSSDDRAICDWCRSEELMLSKKDNGAESQKFSQRKLPREGTRADDKKPRAVGAAGEGSRRKTANGAGSSRRPPARRYKLLKDVLC